MKHLEETLEKLRGELEASDQVRGSTGSYSPPSPHREIPRSTLPFPYCVFLVRDICPSVLFVPDEGHSVPGRVKLLTGLLHPSLHFCTPPCIHSLTYLGAGSLEVVLQCVWALLRWMSPGTQQCWCTGHHLQDVLISEVSLQPCLCWDLPGICGSVC